MTEEKMITIYRSDDDEPCLALLSPKPITTSYPFVDHAPDMTKLKKPKFDWHGVRDWVETDGTSQGAQIQKMQNTIDTLSKQNSNLTDENASLKKLIEAGQKQIGDLGIMVAKSMAKPTAPAGTADNAPAENGGTN